MNELLLAALDKTTIYMTLIVILGIFLLVALAVLWNFGMLWVQTQLSGAPISLFDMVAMRLRRVPLQLIVNARITSSKSPWMTSSSLYKVRLIRWSVTLPWVKL